MVRGATNRLSRSITSLYLEKTQLNLQICAIEVPVPLLPPPPPPPPYSRTDALKDTSLDDRTIYYKTCDH